MLLGIGSFGADVMKFLAPLFGSPIFWIFMGLIVLLAVLHSPVVVALIERYKSRGK